MFWNRTLKVGVSATIKWNREKYNLQQTNDDKYILTVNNVLLKINCIIAEILCNKIKLSGIHIINNVSFKTF